MLLSKVNRRVSAAQPRKKLFPPNDFKKVSQKPPGTAQIKIPAAKPLGGRNKTKPPDVNNMIKAATELDLLPPSDSEFEDEWGNRTGSKLEAFWRPLHRLRMSTKEPPSENHSVKAQAKVEFDNISKRINKVC